MNIPSIELLLAELDRVKAERDAALRVTFDPSVLEKMNALKSALREAKEAFNKIAWSRHPSELLSIKHAAEYESLAVQAVTAINKALGEE